MICATILGNDVAIKAYRDGEYRNAREARLRPLLCVAILAFGAASAGLARAVSGDDATASPAALCPSRP